MRYPRGLTKRRQGWRISLGPGGAHFRKSLPPSTSYEDAEAELVKARKSARAGKRADPAGTFSADVTRYLADHFAGRLGYDERQRHLKLWTDALGADVRREALTRDDVARVLNGWRAAGLSAETCNKRRTALLALFHALDGRGGSNPVREIPKFRPPEPLPRGVAYDLIDAALNALPSCKTRARLAVMAYTGIRPSQLRRLTVDHWDHRQHVITVPGTAKGRGTKPYVVPLSAQAQKALTDFDALDAWGTFTSAPMARMWKAAWVKVAKKAKRRGIAPVPYDLRHSFGTAIYQATGDIQAARKLLGHSTLRMTERYTLAGVPSQQLAAVTAFGKRVATEVATFARRRGSLRGRSKTRK